LTITAGERRRRSDRKRRKRQAIAISGFVVVAIGLAWFFEAQATTTVIFVRHAEQTANGNGDPSLSEQGRARAQALADFLSEVDVVGGVDAVFASQYRRTQQTAAPIAEHLELAISIADADDIGGTAAAILADHKGEIVLLVGHRHTIPLLIAELHGSKQLLIKADDYDHLYVVTIPWFGKVKTLMFRYGPTG
jgi:2,3-bisphosphoglycerate-dependent phosphoglycerate mutase